MTLNELRSKCKRQSDYIITLFITNELSLLLTWLLLKTGVTPNQVTVASILCSLLCGFCYAFGWFLSGSVFLFLSHVLDCTDGNLARAKDTLNPLGKWFDSIGDRAGEVFVFVGVAHYFASVNSPVLWIAIALLAPLMLMLYYYIIDMGLSLGILKSKQEIGKLAFKGVHVKWGLLEPVIYGFIVLAPLGWIKIQIAAVFFLAGLGLVYQAYRMFNMSKSKNS